MLCVARPWSRPPPTSNSTTRLQPTCSLLITTNLHNTGAVPAPPSPTPIRFRRPQALQHPRLPALTRSRLHPPSQHPEHHPCAGKTVRRRSPPLDFERQRPPLAHPAPLPPYPPASAPLRLRGAPASRPRQGEGHRRHATRHASACSSTSEGRESFAAPANQGQSQGLVGTLQVCAAHPGRCGCGCYWAWSAFRTTGFGCVQLSQRYVCLTVVCVYIDSD